MRVLHVITNLERGGAQTSVSQIVGGLRAHGLDAQIAFSSAGGTVPGSHAGLVAELHDGDVPVHDISAMRRSPSARDPVALVQLERLIRQLRPRVVQTHASKAGILGRIAAARAGVPTIIHSVRGWAWQGFSGPARALFVEAERRVAKLTHHFVAVAEAMIDEGIRHAVGERTRYSVIRSGIALTRFAGPHDRAAIRQRLGLTGAQVVGTVARFSPPKAPLDFVAVAARVAALFPRTRFVMDGDGMMRPEIELAIRRARLTSRFVLLGERVDVPEILSAMDAFVLTSRWEGLPRVVIEAAAVGVPIVATDVGGVREIIDHGRSGLVCDPGRVDRLGELVSTLLGDPVSATRMAAMARASLPRDVELSTVVRRHVELYARLAG